MRLIVLNIASFGVGTATFIMSPKGTSQGVVDPDLRLKRSELENLSSQVSSPLFESFMSKMSIHDSVVVGRQTTTSMVMWTTDCWNIKPTS